MLATQQLFGEMLGTDDGLAEDALADDSLADEELAGAIELLGRAAKKSAKKPKARKRKLGSAIAAVVTGGASLVAQGIRRKAKKAQAKVKKQTAGMSPQAKKAFLKKRKGALAKKIGGAFAAVATGGASLVAARAAKAAKAAKAKRAATGPVASRGRPAAVKKPALNPVVRRQSPAAAKASINPIAQRQAAVARGGALPTRTPTAVARAVATPMTSVPQASNSFASQGMAVVAAARKQFPANVATPVTPVVRAPARAVVVSPFRNAAPTPSRFRGAANVRHMSLVEWARYLFAPKYATGYQY